MEKSFNVEDILIKGMKPVYSKDDDNENSYVNLSSEDTYVVDKSMYIKGANAIWG